MLPLLLLAVAMTAACAAADGTALALAGNPPLAVALPCTGACVVWMRPRVCANQSSDRIVQRRGKDGPSAIHCCSTRARAEEATIMGRM